MFRNPDADAETRAVPPTGSVERGLATDPAHQDPAQLDAPRVPGSPGGIRDALQPHVTLAEYRPMQSPKVTAVPFVTRHGERYYIFANRDQGKYLRLAPDEHHLWTLMDGTRTVKDLIYEYFTAFKTLAFDQVAQLVVQLRLNYMLADPPEDVFASVERTSASRRSQSLPRAVWRVITGQHTFEIHHIDGLMGELHRRVGWVLYTPPLQVLYVGLSVVGGALFLRHFASGRYDLFQAGGSYGTGLLLLIGLNFLSVTVHEASHALTCKHYGARVHSAGLMLYFGLPTAFVDTTDIWTKPASARIATTWAGPYSGAILAGLGAVVVQAVPDSWVAPTLHRLSFLWLLTLLFNVIPFLELDGYYMAVDWLEIPLLRARALAFFRTELWQCLRHRQPLTGRERLLAWFGGLSLLFSGLVLASAVFSWEYRLKRVALALWAGGVGSKVVLVVLLLMLGSPLAIEGVERLASAARGAAEWERRWRVPHGRALREREGLLSQVPCLSALSAEELAQVATRMPHQTFRPGQIVVREGTEPDRFYIIARGVAEMWVDDEPRPRRHLTGGDYFGETSLVERVPHPGTVRAASRLSVFTVLRGDFDRWLAAHICAHIDDRIYMVQALRGFSIFADLTSRELDALASRLLRERVPPETVVCQEGDPADAFYLVDSGQAEALVGGQRRRLLHRGSYFGEVALMRHVPQPETVRALTAFAVFKLQRSDFEALVATSLRKVTTALGDADHDGPLRSGGPTAPLRTGGV
ncbi:MAG TPA: cyclic nucleotide-binding domain-containing protein [bacterium]|nr:cyclic nucleotide-binding domain-containing protein [bacterium]